MKKTKVLSVRLQELRNITEKAYVAKGFDGREQVVPKACVFGMDHDVQKSTAWWIAAWFLEKPETVIQYSHKKAGWYNPATGRVEPVFSQHVERHVPEKLSPDPEPVESLNREG